MLDGNRVVLLTESNYSEWFSQFKLLMEKAGALLLLLDKKNVEYVYMKTDIEGDHAKNLLAMNNVQYIEWQAQNDGKWIFGFECGQMVAKHPVEQAAYHRDMERTWLVNMKRAMTTAVLDRFEDEATVQTLSAKLQQAFLTPTNIFLVRTRRARLTEGLQQGETTMEEVIQRMHKNIKEARAVGIRPDDADLYTTLLHAAEELGTHQELINKFDGLRTAPTFLEACAEFRIIDQNRRIRREGKSGQARAEQARVASAGPAARKDEKKRVCYRYRDTGACSFGERCRFGHDAGERGESKSVTAPSDDEPIYCARCLKSHIAFYPDCRIIKAFLNKHPGLYLPPHDSVQFVNIAACGQGEGETHEWYMDSGASSHMCCDRAQFVSITQCPSVVIHVATGQTCVAEWAGTVLVCHDKGQTRFENVLFVPGFTKSLLSVKVLDRQGNKIVIEKGMAVTQDRGNVQFVARLQSGSGGLYVLKGTPREEQARVAEIGAGQQERLPPLSKLPRRQQWEDVAETRAKQEETPPPSQKPPRRQQWEEQDQAQSQAQLEQRYSAMLWEVSTEAEREETEAEQAMVSTTTWHKRFAHVHGRKLGDMAKKHRVAGMRVTGADGKNRSFCSGADCQVCGLTKGRRQPYSQWVEPRDVAPGEEWSFDVLGPFDSGVNGERFIVHFECRRSRFQVTFCTLTKGGLFELWQRVYAWSRVQTGNECKRLTADGAGNTHEFMQWANASGAELHITMRESAGQNGMSERHGGIHAKLTLALMKESQLPANMWPFASDVATHIKNRVPCKSSTGDLRTPYEIVYGSKPDVSDLRVFGCRMYTKIIPAPPKAGALTQDNALEGVFLGYADTVASVTRPDNTHTRKGWIMYSESRRALVYTRDAIFKEDVLPGIRNLPLSGRLVQARRQTVTGGGGGGAVPIMEQKRVEPVRDQEQRLLEMRHQLSQDPNLRAEFQRLKEEHERKRAAQGGAAAPDPASVHAPAPAEQQDARQAPPVRNAAVTPVQPAREDGAQPGVDVRESGDDLEGVEGQAQDEESGEEQEGEPVLQEDVSWQWRERDLKQEQQRLDRRKQQKAEAEAAIRRKKEERESEANRKQSGEGTRRSSRRVGSVLEMRARSFPSVYEDEHADEEALSAEVRTEGVDMGRELERAQQAAKGPSTHEQAQVAQVNRSVPKHYHEAVRGAESEQWHEAMRAHLLSLQEQHVYDFAALPPDKKALPCQWVYDKPTNVDGTIKKYRARLVIRGDLQKKGVDFKETWSPVVNSKSVRVLFALAAHLDLDVFNDDVKTAYLNAPVDADLELYMRQPPGYGASNQEDQVLRLLKAIPGLKQAGRLWNKHIHAELLKMDFKQCLGDPCLYLWVDSETGHIMLIGLYVDDIILATNSARKKTSVQDHLEKKYKMHGMKECEWVLGMRVIRSRDSKIIELDQAQYTEELLEEFGMSECRTVDTPASMTKLSKSMSPQTDAEREQMTDVPYMKAVGALNFLAASTRPDISEAVSAVSSFMSDPGLEHWQAVKRIFRYLRGHPRGIRFDGNKPLTLEGWCDSDFAGDVDRCRSRTGYCMFLAGGPVSWRSRLQRLAARSTAEAEYMAAADATADIMWLRSILQELGFTQVGPTTLRGDNRAAKIWSKDCIINENNKHIRIRYHIVRDSTRDGTVSLDWVESKNNIADLLTKPLAAPQFERLRERLMGCV